jgi:hypothetical protein
MAGVLRTGSAEEFGTAAQGSQRRHLSSSCWFCDASAWTVSRHVLQIRIFLWPLHICMHIAQ